MPAADYDSAVHAQRVHQRLMRHELGQRVRQGVDAEADHRLVRMGDQVLGVVNAAVRHATRPSPATFAALRDRVSVAIRRTA